MTTVRTWGIDVQAVENEFTQLQFLDEGPLTPDAVRREVIRASGVVNGITKALGFDLDDLWLNPRSDECENIRGLVMKVLAPELWEKCYGSREASYIKDLRDERDKCLKEYRNSPRALGADEDSSPRSNYRGSVVGHGLATDVASRDARKPFNKLIGRSDGQPDKKTYW